jgi:hypothetical protein
VLLFDSSINTAIVVGIETSGGPHGYRQHRNGSDTGADERTCADAGTCNARAQEGEESQEGCEESRKEDGEESSQESGQAVREKGREEGFEESEEGREENCKESGQEEKEGEEVEALSASLFCEIKPAYEIQKPPGDARRLLVEIDR